MVGLVMCLFYVVLFGEISCLVVVGCDDVILYFGNLMSCLVLFVFVIWMMIVDYFFRNRLFVRVVCISVCILYLEVVELVMIFLIVGLLLKWIGVFVV